MTMLPCTKSIQKWFSESGEKEFEDLISAPFNSFGAEDFVAEWEQILDSQVPKFCKKPSNESGGVYSNR